MELKKAIRKRRSIREFKDKKIKKEIINDIISNAKYSPSACNRQGWEVILTDSKIIETSIKSPCGLLIIYDNRTDNLEYQDHIQSASAFIQNILLLAYEKKIGTCWVCNLPPKKVLKKTFNLKKFQEPIAYIAMGYPKIIPKAKPRKKKIYKDYFLRRLGRKIYYKTPLRKKIKPMVDKIFERKFK